MAVNIGTTSLAGCYVGTTAVQKIYVGTTEVWSAAPDPVSIVGQASNHSSTVSIPTHQAGDVFLMLASGHTSLQVPTAPGAVGTVPTWNSLQTTGGGGSLGVRLAYAVAASSGRTSGTWTNANSLAVVVLRGASVSNPIGGNAVGANSGIGADIAVHPSVTMAKTDGTSALIHIALTRMLYPGTWDAVPAGYTGLLTQGSASSPGASIMSKNSTTSDGSVNRGTVYGPYGYATASVEVRAH